MKLNSMCARLNVNEPHTHSIISCVVIFCHNRHHHRLQLSHTESKTLILTELKVIPGPTTHSSHFVAVIYTFNASYTHSAQHRINAFKLWNDSFRAAIRMAFLFQFSIIADDLVLISFATKWKINK